MKRYFLFVGVCIIAGIMSSCNNNPEPEDSMYATPQNTLNYLLHYVPYKVGQSLVFSNEDLGREWTVNPYEYKDVYYDPNEEPRFPNIHFMDVRKSGDHVGTWDVEIEAALLEEGVSRIADYLSATSMAVHGNNNTDTVEVLWMPSIRLSQTEYYDGLHRIHYTQEQFLPSLGDTIHLSLYRMRKYEGADYKMVEAPEGCYINMVKDKGLTDFCVDGKTIWKRVK